MKSYSSSLSPSDMNDLWRQRICDAKRLRRLANDADDAGQMDISGSSRGSMLSQALGSVGGVLENGDDKPRLPAGARPKASN
jgi:hypothetical protein